MTSSMTRRTPIAIAIVAFIALLGAVVAPATATAQAGDAEVGPAQLTMSSHVLTDEASFVASVALDVGAAEIGALSAVLDYDRAVLQFVSCTPSDAAVCNEIDGEVHFAGFDVDGFVSNEHFLDIEFVVLDRPAETELELSVETTADVLGLEIDPLEAQSGTVTFLAAALPQAETGGINGEVLDGAGVGLFGAQVCAIAANADRVCTVTTGLGAFVLDAVAPGTHRVLVSDPNLGPIASETVEVIEGEVTTGVSITLDANSESDVEMQGISGPALEGPIGIETEPEAPDAPAAANGEIVVQVRSSSGAFAVFGAQVCATMPVIGTQSCGFSDVAGVVRLADLAVGNYELSAVDPAGRFDPATPIFVGLNPSEGVNEVLDLPAPGLGEPPEVLAFVDPSPRSETLGFALAAIAMAALTAAGVARRRHSSEWLGE